MNIKETFWTFVISAILLLGGWVVMSGEPDSEKFSDQLSFGLASMGAGIFLAAGGFGMFIIVTHWIGRFMKSVGRLGFPEGDTERASPLVHTPPPPYAATSPPPPPRNTESSILQNPTEWIGEDIPIPPPVERYKKGFEPKR